MPAKPAGEIDRHRLPARIPAHRMQARHPFDLGKRGEDFSDDRQCPRGVFVVTVEPSHDLARRLGESLVDGVVLTSVGFADRIGQPARIAIDDFCASVGRTPVDDDILHMRISLREHGLHGLFQELGLVERRSDDGNGRASFSHDGGRQTLCPSTAAFVGFGPAAAPRSRRNDAGGKGRPL